MSKRNDNVNSKAPLGPKIRSKITKRKKENATSRLIGKYSRIHDTLLNSNTTIEVTAALFPAEVMAYYGQLAAQSKLCDKRASWLAEGLKSWSLSIALVLPFATESSPISNFTKLQTTRAPSLPPPPLPRSSGHSRPIQASRCRRTKSGTRSSVLRRRTPPKVNSNSQPRPRHWHIIDNSNSFFRSAAESKFWDYRADRLAEVRIAGFSFTVLWQQPP
ncbi:hypothetical protein K440DRAFT_643367 [Wilcoxina mikolae CBS 423.85]|nr:hypothetical protein K440DRAFT_643367 [Wilcoxina mikolae CBS 423.85]